MKIMIPVLSIGLARNPLAPGVPEKRY